MQEAVLSIQAVLWAPLFGRDSNDNALFVPIIASYVKTWFPLDHYYVPTSVALTISTSTLPKCRLSRLILQFILVKIITFLKSEGLQVTSTISFLAL